MTMFVSNGKSDEDGYQETIDSLKDELAACEKELADLKSHDHAPCVLCDPLRQQLAASEKEANKWFVLHQALEKEVERLKTINKDVMASLDRYRASGYELEQRVSELTAEVQARNSTVKEKL